MMVVMLVVFEVQGWVLELASGFGIAAILCNICHEAIGGSDMNIA